MTGEIYQVVMAAVYHADGLWGEATFDLFPRAGQAGQWVVAGVEEAVAGFTGAQIPEERIAELQAHPIFAQIRPGFFDHLRRLRLDGEIRSVPEGTVVQERTLVGIVSRANLLRAFAALPVNDTAAPASDSEIRFALTRELTAQAWSRRADNSVVVTNGVAHLWGLVSSQEEARALEIVAQGVPGVREVQNHTVVLSDGTYPIYPGSFIGG